MQVRTDDEVYRVDAVWLGPPKATFPWRARYVAWGVGILVFFIVFGIQRAIGFGFGFFTIAWGLVITVALTRFICSRISHERPLTAVLTMWGRELTAPTGGDQRHRRRGQRDPGQGARHPAPRPARAGAAATGPTGTAARMRRPLDSEPTPVLVRLNNGHARCTTASLAARSRRRGPVAHRGQHARAARR